jgi:hypothetical protein
VARRRATERGKDFKAVCACKGASWADLAMANGLRKRIERSRWLVRENRVNDHVSDGSFFSRVIAGARLAQRASVPRVLADLAAAAIVIS